MKTIKAIFHGFRLFKDIASASPFRIPLELLSAGLEVFGHIFIRILLVRRILDLVVSGRYLDTFLLIFLSAAADLAVSGFEAWMKEYYRLKDAVRLHEAFQKKLYHRAAGVELMYYDTPEYYDKFLLAAGNIDKTAGKLLQSGREFLVSLSEILLSGGLILSNMSGLLPIVLIPSTLYGFVSVRNARARVEFLTAVTPPQKKMNYAKKIFFTKEAALDLRTTGLKGLLLDLLDEGGEEAVRRGTLSMNKMLFFAFLQGGLFYFQYTALMVVLAYRALTLQSISVGDFSMLFMSALTLGNNWRFFGNTLGELAEYGYFSGQYYDFLRLPVPPAALSGTETEINYTPSDHGSSDIRTTSSRLLHPETKLPVSSAPEESKSDIPHSVEILFTKVSFTYPGNTNNRKEILKEISFSLQKGEKIAIVGQNGAGKSTLANLLLGFYSPLSGEILHNGSRSSEESQLYFAPIFQDSRLYPFTVAENLLLHPPKDKAEAADVENVLRQVGLWDRINALPQRTDTPVTKEFEKDGVVFSGGETQRLVLARALLQKRQAYIFDEPTSAQDPKAESELNHLFADLLSHQTLILITHRLSTLPGMDRIYLLDDGKITESGSHEELMSQNGRYAHIYRTQAKLYSME